MRPGAQVGSQPSPGFLVRVTSYRRAFLLSRCATASSINRLTWRIIRADGQICRSNRYAFIWVRRSVRCCSVGALPMRPISKPTRMASCVLTLTSSMVLLFLSRKHMEMMHFLSFPFLVFVYLLSIRPCGCPQGTSLEWVDCVWSALCYWRTEPCLFTFMLKTSLLQSTYT